MISFCSNAFKDSLITPIFECFGGNLEYLNFTDLKTTVLCPIERKVLMNLINNKELNDDDDEDIDNKKPKADFIGGPFTLTLQWSETYKKLIYIFGERHTHKTDCEYFNFKEEDAFFLIEEYIKHLIDTTDAFIDFYLEIPGKNDIYHFDNERLWQLWSYFNDCIPPNKNPEKCKLSRIHFFDIRKKIDIKLNSVSQFNLVGVEIRFVIREQIVKTDKKRTIKLLAEIIKPGSIFIRVIEDIIKIDTEEKFLAFWMNQIDQFEFLNKKVLKTSILPSIIKDFIKQEITNSKFMKVKEIESINKMFIVAMDILNKCYSINKEEYIFENLDDANYDKLLKYLGGVYEYTVNLNSFIPDGYLLARIFKEFDIDTQNPLKQRPTDEPREPRNIIIYAGDKHSDRVRKFLDEVLDFTLLNQAGKEWPKPKQYEELSSRPEPIPSNCIDMRAFPQPFFCNDSRVDWLAKPIGKIQITDDTVSIKEEMEIGDYLTPDSDHMTTDQTSLTPDSDDEEMIMKSNQLLRKKRGNRSPSRKTKSDIIKSSTNKKSIKYP
jgi:hypothetical protein